MMATMMFMIWIQNPVTFLKRGINPARLTKPAKSSTMPKKVLLSSIKTILPSMKTIPFMTKATR